MVSTTPVARFSVTALALFANLAAIRAQSNVDNTQKKRHDRSGIPPITKWLTEPVWLCQPCFVRKPKRKSLPQYQGWKDSIP